MQSYFAAVFAADKTGEIKWNALHVAVPYVNYFFWVLLAPMIYVLSNNVDFTKSNKIKDIGKVLVWGFLLSFFHEFITSMLYYVPNKVILGGKSIGELFQHLNVQYFTFAISTRILEFLGIFILFIGLKYYRKYVDSRVNLEQVKSELYEAQFRALKMQLHPHFLFNTLNSISSLIDEDRQLAQRMVAQLGDLLRKILDHGQKTEVTLAEELEFIKNYLSIELVRFINRLEVVYSIQKETLVLKVPNLILQPIVENSIKHGFTKKTDGCTIWINTLILENYLEIRVIDNGLGAITKKLHREGVGIANVSERLEKFYNGDAFMAISTPDSGGFEVTLKMKVYDTDGNH